MPALVAVALVACGGGGGGGDGSPVLGGAEPVAAVCGTDELGRADLLALQQRVFVDPRSSAADNGCGSAPDSACSSVQAGIDRCAAAGAGAACGVLLRHGVYQVASPIALKDGIAVYGSCRFGNEADFGQRTVLLGAAPASSTPVVQANGLTHAATRLSGVVVIAKDERTVPGAASVALLAVQTSGITIAGNVIASGPGGDGAIIATPVATAGEAGEASRNDALGPRTAGGRDMCGGSGGRGGFGGAGQRGTSTGFFSQSCAPGNCECSVLNGSDTWGDAGGAAGGQPGGAGYTTESRPGPWCQAADPNLFNGVPGGLGLWGHCATFSGSADSDVRGRFEVDLSRGAAAATVSWRTGPGGTAGGAGTNGSGGGGGSGGGFCIDISRGTTDNDPIVRHGVPAGGGGSGGCGGAGGAGGGNGGGSFAALLWGSSIVGLNAGTNLNVVITGASGVGGNGGAGAAGGRGGAGGAGGVGGVGLDKLGSGAVGLYTCPGPSGNGGDGGDGGSGGGGGGGNSGPAAGMVLLGGSAAPANADGFYPVAPSPVGAAGPGASSRPGACTSPTGAAGVQGVSGNWLSY